ncbi:MAG: septation protein IspZ [Proteobacteria bacterium]|nr:septation protein IspZ [Pseudomonadota bacterium]
MKNLAFAIRPILLDMLSTLVFAAIFALTHNIVVSVALGIALGIGQVAWLKIRRRPVAGMQWASLGLVIVFGAATILTHDPRFVMIKPTIAYTAIGLVMLQPGWLERYMPPRAKLYLPASMTIGAGYVWSALMFFTAAANLYVAMTMGTKVWTEFLAVFPLASKLVLFALHFGSFRIIGGLNAKAGRTFAHPADVGLAGELGAEPAVG